MRCLAIAATQLSNNMAAGVKSRTEGRLPDYAYVPLLCPNAIKPGKACLRQCPPPPPPGPGGPT